MCEGCTLSLYNTTSVYLTIAQWDWHYYHSTIISETGSEKLSNLPNITWLVRGKRGFELSLCVAQPASVTITLCHIPAVGSQWPGVKAALLVHRAQSHVGLWSQRAWTRAMGSCQTHSAMICGFSLRLGFLGSVLGTITVALRVTADITGEDVPVVLTTISSTQELPDTCWWKKWLEAPVSSETTLPCSFQILIWLHRDGIWFGRE